MATVIITADKGEALRPLTVNGRNYPYSYGVPVELPDEALATLRNTDLSFTITDTESPAPSATQGNGDAGGDGEPGGQHVAASDSAPVADPDGFDPEEVIKGTVGEVTERLANLTREQLEAVKAAEIDREQPRIGVGRAIEAALEAFNPDA